MKYCQTHGFEIFVGKGKLKFFVEKILVTNLWSQIWIKLIYGCFKYLKKVSEKQVSLNFEWDEHK